MGEDVGDLSCPYCGYDLRGVMGVDVEGAGPVQRCSECGGDVSQVTLSTLRSKAGRLPWFHRRTLGNVLAFRKTVWLMLWRPHRLGSEVGVPVDGREAARFLRWTTWPLAVVAAVAMGAWVSQLPRLYALQRPMDVGLPTGIAELSRDLLWPMMISIQPWWVGLMFGLIVWVLPRSLVTAFVFVREGGLSTERGLRTATLSRYLGAGIIPLGVALTIYGFAGALTADPEGVVRSSFGKWLDLSRVLAVGIALCWTPMTTAFGLVSLLRGCRVGALHVVLSLLLITVQTVLVLATIVAAGMWLPGYVRLMWPAL